MAEEIFCKAFLVFIKAWAWWWHKTMGIYL